MRREGIMELKTQGFVDQLVEDLAHCNRFDAIQRLGQNQKPSDTKDTSNGPREVTHGHMGTQLVKLNEIASKILGVKCIPKMLKKLCQKVLLRKDGT
jgi:hypothetical protein